MCGCVQRTYSSSKSLPASAAAAAARARSPRQVSAKELHALLAKPSLDGIPLLVLGNKNDLPGAADTHALIDKLQLQVRRARA